VKAEGRIVQRLCSDFREPGLRIGGEAIVAFFQIQFGEAHLLQKGTRSIRWVRSKATACSAANSVAVGGRGIAPLVAPTLLLQNKTQLTADSGRNQPSGCSFPPQIGPARLLLGSHGRFQ
jgi:hypothetical protein